MIRLLSLILVISTGFSRTEAGCSGSDCPSTGSRSQGREPLWVQGYPKPIITQHPQSHNYFKGEKIVLTCKAMSDIDVKVVWRKDKKALDLLQSKNYASSYTIEEKNNNESETSSSSSGINMKEFINELHLQDLEESDQGSYSCAIINKFGRVTSNKAKLTMHSVPSFSKIPSNITVKAGATARLECLATGQPVPQISLAKDGGLDFPAASERRMMFMTADNSFYIIDTKVEDIGVYSCRAKNLAGEVVANASLMVIQDPQFIRDMKDKTCSVGETAVLECASVGSPRPTLIWTRDGSPLVLTDRHFLTADDQLLVITDVQERDAGSYSCQIVNPFGSVRQSLTLSVVSPQDKSSQTWMPLLTVFVCIFCAFVLSIAIYLTFYPPIPRLSKSSEDLKKQPDEFTGQTELSGMTPDVADTHVIDKEDMIEC